ncbi:hypothetical protein FGO68_gene11536 [Halteria grandinella]|uniref:Uncharacterized protein n=1 Tax=Halteria grandinella TaxID=5974 RepID=A0A8J8P1X9_HALGN|nr:hypothetical protein FGO68_gene11536 [Halteria grandinella]
MVFYGVQNRNLYMRMLQYMQKPLISLSLIQKNILDAHEEYFAVSIPTPSVTLNALKLCLPVQFSDEKKRELFLSLEQLRELKSLALPKQFIKGYKPPAPHACFLHHLPQTLSSLKIYGNDQNLELSLVEINNMFDGVLKNSRVSSFSLCISKQPYTTGGFMPEEDKKAVFKKVISLIKCGRFIKLNVKLEFINEKDKISFGEMAFRTLTNSDIQMKTQYFNGINIGQYLIGKDSSKVFQINPSAKQLKAVQNDLSNFHLLHQIYKLKLDQKSPIKLQFNQKLHSAGVISPVKQLLNQLILVSDQQKGLNIWLSEFLTDLLITKSLTLFNFQLFLQSEIILDKDHLSGEKQLPQEYNTQRWNSHSSGIDYEFQHRYNHLFKRKLKSMYCTLDVFQDPFEMLMLLRLSSQAVKTLIIDLSDLNGFSEEVVRYSMHELNKVEQLIIHAKHGEVQFKTLAYLLDKNKETLTKLCLDIPIEEAQVKQFTTIILNMNKLRHFHLTANTKIDKIQSNQCLSALKHILSKDSLVSVIIDLFPLLDDFSIIGFSSHLQQLILNISIPLKSTKRDYCKFIFQLLQRLATLHSLEVVHIKLIPLPNKRVSFFSVEPDDKLDKDVMSLTKHILSTKKTLRIWNVFYPLKANYLKTLSHALEPFFFGTEKNSLEMLNNIKIGEAAEFFMNSKCIDIDIDRQYSQVDVQPTRKDDLVQYDNYHLNTTFTSMMNSFFIDVLKRVYLAIVKHPQQTLEVKVCFDGDQNFSLREIVQNCVKEDGVFSLRNFIRVTLNMSVSIQSNFLIFLALLFMEGSKLKQLGKLDMGELNLYDVDMMYLLTYFQPKAQLLVNLTTLNFKRCIFKSNSVSEKLGDFPKLDFSLIFNLPNLQAFNFSYSNFLKVITDENLAKFCDKLKESQFSKYIGFAEVQTDYINIRKYQMLLNHIPDCQKANFSYNILLPKSLIDSVLLKVENLKLTFRNCQSLQVNIETKAQEIDTKFLEVASFIVNNPHLIKVQKIQFHPKMWLTMKQGDGLADGGASQVESFWFTTNCIHEFLINMEFARAQKGLKILLIKDFNLMNFGLGLQFNQLLINCLNAGCFDNLEYFGLVNVNLPTYVQGKARSQNAQQRLEFLKEMSLRCTKLADLDIKSNMNLTVPSLSEIVYTMRECASLKRIYFFNEKGKWPLNSKQYLDLQNQVKALISGTQRTCQIDKIMDVITFELATQ